MKKEKVVNKGNKNFRFFSKDVILEEESKSYVIKKIAKMEKFLQEPLNFEIEISLDKKGKFYVEIMIKTPHKLYRATQISESIEASIDTIVEELQKQIINDKDKIKDIRKRGARSLKKKIVISKDARFRKI